MFDFLFSIWNEFLSNFVPEKVSYKITGECKKCGKCCNYMYSMDTYTEKEFKMIDKCEVPEAGWDVIYRNAGAFCEERIR